MQFSTTQLAALAAFLPALASAHMQLVAPASVFIREGIPNAPLDPSGSDYPCMITSNSKAAAPEFPQGSSQVVTLEGSAIHGGGSCQISITYDNPPTKASVFKVVKSFQGNCPTGSATGNLASSGKQDLPFRIPSDLPTGNAVVAWTWFNKIGNREMYMRCAPVKITGSTPGSQASFNALPDILKANIKNIGADTCTTAEGVDITFPNPGKDVTGTGTGGPQGNCGTKVVIPAPSSKPVLIEQPPATTTTTAVAPPPTTTTVVNKPQVPTTTSTRAGSRPTTTSTPTKPNPDDKPSQAPPKGACTNGQIVCTSATTFSVCDWGVLVPMGAVADGTECSQGSIVMAKKLAVRFSHDHKRRRHNAVF